MNLAATIDQDQIAALRREAERLEEGAILQQEPFQRRGYVGAP